MNGKPFSSQYAVHPHIRGAYQFPRPVPVPHIGSSPPTWGIRCSTAPTIDISRFIPTYVGHTGSAHVFCPPLPVHPHIRGVYDHLDLGIVGPARFIPTYVGHTWGNDRAAIPLPVHPHIRGAYEGSRGVSPAHGGSSPHTWGILLPAQEPRTRSRFIPTYVGHTGPLTNSRPVWTVHPHIRGAYGFLHT